MTAASVLGVRGGLSVDHLVTVGSGARFNQLGGPGLYAALGGRLLDGATVRLATNLPLDDPRFGELFGRLDIDLAHSVDLPTVPRVWILTAPEGRRIVETTPQSAVELEVAAHDDDSDAELPAGQDFYDGLGALLDSSPLERPSVPADVLVGIDPHQVPLLRDGLAYLRRVTSDGAVVLPSRVQLGLIDPDPRVAARRIADELDVSVVARLDRDGMYVVSHADAWTVRDDAVDVQETTGAGDSSAAAIMAALALGADLVTAAMFGASVARIALSDWGAAALVDAAPLSAPFNRIRSNQEN
jgi:sugar/nucleoside kinase (ribokinase family)